MIPPEILQRKSLFDLLYKLDVDLAESVRAKRCPAAGAHCIAPVMSASLGVGPRIFARHMGFVSVCAVDDRGVGAGFFRPRCSSGVAVSIGGRWSWWSRH